MEVISLFLILQHREHSEINKLLFDPGEINVTTILFYQRRFVENPHTLPYDVCL